jgi:GNAT superfamily N-acetyltransferase
MTLGDAERVALLSEQLGYPVTIDEISTRFARITATPGNVIYVALNTARIAIGWIHVHAIERLEFERYAEIGGIVVDESSRGLGVGRALMASAESWALAQGFRRVRLSSGAQRTEAHQFYERINYANIRTSFRFERIL